MVDIALHPPGLPDQRGWGPGWPTAQTGKMVNVTWSNGVSPIGGVRQEIAKLVQILGDETIRRGYHPHIGWCWGYANRAISGTNIPSNHSWGLAVDINAPTNPRTDHLVTDMPSWMPDLWNTYGFRWGGDYRPPIEKDAMHYEFMGTPAQAGQALAEAQAAFTPKPPDPKPPAPKKENGMTAVTVDNTAAKCYLVASDLSKAVHVSEQTCLSHRAGGGVYQNISLADWNNLVAAGMTVH